MRGGAPTSIIYTTLSYINFIVNVKHFCKALSQPLVSTKYCENTQAYNIMTVMRAMRILLLGDLHFTGVITDVQQYMLFELVRQINPDVVLHAGDLNTCDMKVLSVIDSDYFFDDVLNGVPFYTVYGNHDSDAIKDIKNLDGTPILLNDGMNEVAGLKIFAFNGIFGFSNKRWYHRSLDDVVKLAFKHHNEEPDIMITHEVPYGNWSNKISVWKYHNVLNFAVDFIKPKMYLFGHLHIEKSYNATMFDNTYVLRVDSSSRYKAFAVAEYDDKVKSIDIFKFDDFLAKSDIHNNTT